MGSAAAPLLAAPVGMQAERDRPGWQGHHSPKGSAMADGAEQVRLVD